nr:PREDICTED: sorting nexin-32 [Latimeria chalumnae]|eukprot:XP_014345194.1 PREDICTED: sorting nexin-32 [Latimeria chalumnae]
MEENQELFVGEVDKPRSVSVDLQNDTSLQVEISDAVSERDKVKFTVHTKTTLSHFKKTEFSVVRQHEEFIWLHDVYTENEDYAGIIIPPAPPKPDFEASREKLQKLGEGDGSMTREEFAKMKQELEARKRFRIVRIVQKKPLYPAHMRISFHSCFSTEAVYVLQDLLYRRLRALADYENANKALDKARMKNKEVKQAEAHQQLCCQKFEKISESAKQELTDFKVRRVAAFRKNLIELTELELKHAKASSLLLRNSLIAFKDDQ